MQPVEMQPVEMQPVVEMQPIEMQTLTEMQPVRNAAGNGQVTKENNQPLDEVSEPAANAPTSC